MPGFVVGGGKIDAEGFLKFLLLAFNPGYATGLNATQRAAGANMTVDINVNTAGYAGALLNTSANIPYLGWISALDTASIAASDPSNPRIDVVVAYVDLTVISTSITDNTGAFKFKAVTGTPAGSPVAPNSAAIQASVGAGNPWIYIASVAVAAAASSIVNANVTDLRVPMAFKVGYLIGGALNTKGHLVPNLADASLVTTGDTGSVSGAMLSTSAIELGYAQINAGPFLPGTTSETDITGVVVTVNVPAGSRDLEIVAQMTVYNTGGADTVTLKIKEGATVLATARQYTSAINITNTKTFTARIAAPSAGSHTYKVSIAGSVANPAVQLSASEQASILVKAT